MRLQPYTLLAVSAALDIVIAAALWAMDFVVIGALMAVVAVVGFVLAYVLWQRSR
jgi:hypothetical protein